MTNCTHLDRLVEETEGELARKLVQEFCKLARDPDVASATYASKLRALMDEQLQAGDAPS